jgi:hypothetical protein
MTTCLSGVRRQKSEEGMKPPAKGIQDLLVWEKAHQFVLSRGTVRRAPTAESRLIYQHA